MLSSISFLKNNLKAKNLDGVIILNENNIYYLTKLDCPGMLIISKDENIFLTYDKYVEYAESIITLEDMISVLKVEDMPDIRKLLKNAKKIGIESKYMTIADYNDISKVFDANLVDISEIIEKMRAVKDDDTITIIEENSEILSRIMEDVKNILKEGISEKEVYEYICEDMITEDMQKISVMVSFGKYENVRDSDKLLQKDDIAVISIIAKKNGYVSKIARTFFKGNFLENNDELKEKYEELLRLHDYMLRKIKSGEKIEKVVSEIKEEFKDLYIENIYSLGHSIGIEKEEFPTITNNCNYDFRENMTLCIMPEIYFKDYYLCIHDSIRLTKVNYIMLTKLSREIEDITI